MTALRPGLYRATVRGLSDQIGMVQDEDGDFLTMQAAGGWWCHPAHFITDARPLIVLDIDNWLPGRVEALPRWIRNQAALSFGIDEEFAADIADQIEAQTRPPRIPEPGLWGVVEAALDGNAERMHFVRGTLTLRAWLCNEDASSNRWDNLIDPVLIRPGIEDPS